MKKIVVSVGTTPFNSLFQNLDHCRIPEGVEIECQIASGSYIPQNFSYFRFTEDFDRTLSSAHAVISHAGAGNVFKLLEMGKPAIVVANLERKDPHQLELARYVNENNLALGLTELSALQPSLNKILSFQPSPYQKTGFFLKEQLNASIQQALRMTGE